MISIWKKLKKCNSGLTVSLWVILVPWVTWEVINGQWGLDHFLGLSWGLPDSLVWNLAWSGGGHRIWQRVNSDGWIFDIVEKTQVVLGYIFVVVVCLNQRKLWFGCGVDCQFSPKHAGCVRNMLVISRIQVGLKHCPKAAPLKVSLFVVSVLATR